MTMMLSEAIELCKLHVRRATWLTESDWRHLLDQSAKQLQRMTNILAADFRVQLVDGVRVYDLSASGAYRIIEDARMGTSTVYMRSRSVLKNRDIDTPGTPQFVYEDGAFRIGLWPVPDSTVDGSNLYVRCLYFPDDINVSTPLTQQLPFEPGHHDIVVMGAVLLAERIDTDIIVSRDIRNDYETGVVSMRAAAQARVPGSSTMRRFDGGR